MDGRNRNARICPKCGADQSHVYDSRVNRGNDFLERRRKCGVCGARWKTVEIEYKAFAAITKKGRAK